MKIHRGAKVKELLEKLATVGYVPEKVVMIVIHNGNNNPQILNQKKKQIHNKDINRQLDKNYSILHH